LETTKRLHTACMAVTRAITVPWAPTMASPATTAATVAQGTILDIDPVVKMDESHPFFYFFKNRYVKLYSAIDEWLELITAL
jgi:hypothetical protein